ncbi:MAG: hypothetical protein HW414_662 [Dehalococcoidia bacterium]|nr:hypothetical protein [Dehalococcoidia bacterium]
MKRWGLLLVAGFLLMAFVIPLAASAQEEVKPPTFSLSPRFPSVVGKADSTFRFKVDLNYDGTKSTIVNFSATAPQGWDVRILGGIPEVDIRQMRLEAFKSFPDSIDVEITPPRGNVVVPGEYTATLEAMESPPGKLQSKVELKAVVTARHLLVFSTEGGMLNTSVRPGEENIFPLALRNGGTVALEKVTFSSSKPEGWSITFRPDTVDTIPVGGVQTVEAVIKPPKRTIAGDYGITLLSQSENVSETLAIRVTVLTPTIWGWVGVIIALAVIAGLGLVFWRFGRR